eukprot:GHRR01025708.1.p1 GENE.GHRR01025708.1~~GHRR01025708.1.p1  ORF type:complete len:153 (+),score=81.73 GHRR01025708.1:594-1052(+)
MVYCGLPNESDRLAILKAVARKLQLAADVDLAAIACSTQSFTGADLAALLSEAQLLAVHEQLERQEQQQQQQELSPKEHDEQPNNAAAIIAPVVNMQHLSCALSHARPSLPPAEQRRLAAIYSRFQQGRDPGLSNRDLLSEEKQQVKHATLA